MANGSSGDRYFTHQEAVVGFREDTRQFTISFAVPGTIDSQIVCILRDASLIPPALRKAGTRVVFSGRATGDAALPPPVLGGQQMLLLGQVDSIRAL